MLKRIALACSALLLVAGTCAERAPEEVHVTDPPPAQELPEWVIRVQPEPGAQMQGTGRIEVTHKVVQEPQQVRLIVDGVDVTTEAERSATKIDFTPQTSRLVQVRPGDHTATIELAEFNAETQTLDIIDSFTWSFRMV